jgi:hypothetical protein
VAIRVSPLLGDGASTTERFDTRQRAEQERGGGRDVFKVRGIDRTATWRRAIVSMAVPSLFLLSACSSPSPLCQSIENLQSDVQGLRDVDMSIDGADEALATEADAVRTSFAAVKQEANDAFSSDIGAVESAIDGIDEIVQQVQGGTPLTDVATQAGAAVTAVVTSIEGLVQTAQEQGCD